MGRFLPPLLLLVIVVLLLAWALPGEMLIEVRGYQVRSQGVFVGLALLSSFLLLHAVLRGIEHLMRWPIRRHARALRRKQSRGLDAVTDALEALLSRDAARAENAAVRVGTYLARPRLHLLLSAQAAALKGDSAKAEQQLEQLHYKEPTNCFATTALIRAAHTQHHPERALHLAESSYNDNKRDAASIKLYAAELVRQENTAGLERLLSSWTFRWHIAAEQRRTIYGYLAFLQGRNDEVLNSAAADSALYVLALKKACAASPDKALALVIQQWNKHPTEATTALLWDHLRPLPAAERKKKIAALGKKAAEVPGAARLLYWNAVLDGDVDAAESLRRHHAGVDGAALIRYRCATCTAEVIEPTLVCSSCFAVDSLRLAVPGSAHTAGVKALV